METKIPKKTPALTRVPASKDKPENRKFPPDPYGDFERALAASRLLGTIVQLSGLEGRAGAADA